MKKSGLLLVCLLTACGESPRLEEGEWTGALTPMNHPDVANPVRYDVSYEGNDLSILLIGPGGDAVATEDARVTDDTLFFAFNEPEEQVRLSCALGRQSTENESFAGRCTDPTGKWARFTMNPPD